MVLRINHLSCVAHCKLILSLCTRHAFNYISYSISPIHSNQISPKYPAKAHQILSQPIQPCAYHVIVFHSRCILQPELKDRWEYGVDCGTMQWYAILNTTKIDQESMMQTGNKIVVLRWQIQLRKKQQDWKELTSSHCWALKHSYGFVAREKTKHLTYACMHVIWPTDLHDTWHLSQSQAS